MRTTATVSDDGVGVKATLKGGGKTVVTSAKGVAALSAFKHGTRIAVTASGYAPASLRRPWRPPSVWAATSASYTAPDAPGVMASPPATAILSSQLYGSGFIVQQAFASITWGQLTLDFGKFTTTAGAEVIESNKNWLYSRSLLFFGIPLLHTGARANFKASDQLTIQASVVNGWNNDPDNNGDKTFGLSANITPSSMLNVIATTYFGNEVAILGLLLVSGEASRIEPM